MSNKVNKIKNDSIVGDGICKKVKILVKVKNIENLAKSKTFANIKANRVFEKNFFIGKNR